MVYLKDSNITMTSAAEVAKVFQDVFALEDEIEQDKEHFYIMHLNIRSKVKMVELLNIGVLTSSVVHPRETFRRAIIVGSASIIIAHNHPSRKAGHSDKDTNLTKRILEDGNIIGIAMLDHIIFTKKSTGALNRTGGEKGLQSV